MLKKVLTKLFALALVAVFVLAACGPGGQPDADTASAAHQLPADFEVSVYQGKDVVGGDEFQFSELLGQGKPVVLNMWAGLCPPCRLEMPDFQAVHEEFSDEIILFGLDVGPFTNLGSNADGKALLQELGVTYPAGTTSERDVVREYGLIGMPTTYFIKPNGEIVEQWTGLLTEDKLTELVQTLLEESGS